MQLNPGDTLGKYTVTRFLGSGSFGSVYLMRDTLMARDCAVKFVENQDPRSFVAHFEAQVLNQCRHDRIVSVHSVDVVADAHGKLYAAIDMEFVSGGSAQDLLQSGHVSIRRAVKLLIDVLFDLQHAHQHQILHRDVKPSNIMLAGNRAKLTDFGLATNAAMALTASGAGSPVYCAPEVLGNNITNVQTDIFSAGMTLFQLVNNISNLAARVPSADLILKCQVISTIGYKSYVPRRLRLICNKACNSDPARRFQSAAEMRQALESLHIKEDWTKVARGHWEAEIRGQRHELQVEDGPPTEVVYRVNGRRRNANCSQVRSKPEARALQNRWVYDHTF